MSTERSTSVAIDNHLTLHLSDGELSQGGVPLDLVPQSLREQGVQVAEG